eukprot:m51a1_g5007 hypothetical protein (414) ;mRNA; f:243334-245902
MATKERQEQPFVPFNDEASSERPLPPPPPPLPRSSAPPPPNESGDARVEDIDRRLRALEAREKQLDARERLIEKLEAQQQQQQQGQGPQQPSSSSPYSKPPRHAFSCPHVARQDFAGDMPAGGVRSLARTLYGHWLATLVLLAYNAACAACLRAARGPSEAARTTLGLALAELCAWAVLALLVYRAAYGALRTFKPTRVFCALALLLAQTLVHAFACLGLEQSGFCGVVVALRAGPRWLRVVCGVDAALWAASTLLLLYAWVHARIQWNKHGALRAAQRAKARQALQEWEGCDDSSQCDQPYIPRGEVVCCHAGDRRCMTMSSCRWANKVDKTNRNCDCIAYDFRGGHVPRWGGCKVTSDCDPVPVGNKPGQPLFCHYGDRRCLTDADCKWANAVDHTKRDCSHMVDHCYNGG